MRIEVRELGIPWRRLKDFGTFDLNDFRTLWAFLFCHFGAVIKCIKKYFCSDFRYLRSDDYNIVELTNSALIKGETARLPSRFPSFSISSLFSSFIFGGWYVQIVRILYGKWLSCKVFTIHTEHVVGFWNNLIDVRRLRNGGTKRVTCRSWTWSIFTTARSICSVTDGRPLHRFHVSLCWLFCGRYWWD